ncbi:hypothetical protein F5Y04DRAFT_260624 [Hypomontagnella monticulosa]|nr:hypothetical protein F5Y04DRAFT_260624 [Hypomontagnella monticulosa]
MPSDNGVDRSFGNSSFDEPPTTTNAPWPYIDRSSQAQIEQKFFENGATIHFERLPSIQSWAPLLLVKDSYRVAFIATKVLRSAAASQRRLTADEINATSEAAALSFRYLPWIQAASLTTTALITWATRRRFRFPFYTPKPTSFHPFTFPTRTRPFLTGNNALYAWHAARFCCYFPLLWIGNAMYLISITETRYEAYIFADPRTKKMIQDIRSIPGSFRARVNNPLHQQRSPNSADASQPQETPSPRSPLGYQQGPAQQASQDYGRDTYSNQPEESGFRGSAAPPTRSAPASTPQSSWSRNSQPQTPDTKHSDDLDLFGDDDDASPVSAASRRAEARQARNSQGSSAWDRIRQQSQSGSAQWAKGDSSGQESGWGQLRQDKTHNSKDGQRKTEGFAYSKQDEDKEKRNYEKEQAQKDFDALLESERRGGSNR